MSNNNKPPMPRRKRVISKKNHTHQVSHLFPFPNQNESIFFISNVNMNTDPNAAVEIANQDTFKLEDVKIETRAFPVLTKSNGFPRIIQEIKLNLGNKTLTLTSMTTNLKTSSMTDEYFSQIVSTLSTHNVINEYKLDMMEEENGANEKVANVNIFSNNHGDNRKNQDQDIKQEEKILELSNTLVNQRNDKHHEIDDEEENNDKKLFTIKKKITKQKNEIS